MDIIPLGLSSFKIKGKSASVVTDPFDPKLVGLPYPKHTTADIITISHSHPDHNFPQILEKEATGPIIFFGPGEYEAKGVDILGVATYHDTKQGEERGKNTVYKIEIDGLAVVHLGDLGHKLSDEQIDLIDNVDVLMIPVGGVYTIDAKVAHEVITDLEPKLVIPMHYLCKGLDPKIFGTLSTVADFLKEMGKTVAPVPRLKITKDTLPADIEIVVLE